MNKFVDLVGQKFGHLTVTERSEKRKKGMAFWICHCDCGNTTQPIRTADLKNGKTKSCGCLQNKPKHGMSYSRIYQTWADMKGRCYNQNNQSFKNYGGRGIKVCDEWKNDFKTFYDWAMSNGYEDHLTIDRKDANGNYEPSNCRWATYKVQENNTRRNHFLTYNGKTQTMKEWAEEVNINYNTLVGRINRLHWTVEKALTTK